MKEFNVCARGAGKSERAGPGAASRSARGRPSSRDRSAPLPGAPRGERSDRLRKDPPGAAPDRARAPETPLPRTRDSRRRRARTRVLPLLFACAALLGAGTAWADTLVSNLGQTTIGATADLSTNDFSQAFTTGATVDAYTYSGVKVEFSTVPTSSAMVSAFIADGLSATDTVVANLTNPGTWSTTSTFGIPSGTTFAANTTYYLIIEATDGLLAQTASNNEDIGGVTGWSIANGRDRRQMESDTGLGGTWTSGTSSLHIAVEGDHKGTVTSCSAASMEHQVWTATLTVGTATILGFQFKGWRDTGVYDGANLTDQAFTFNGESYDLEDIHDGAGTGFGLSFNIGNTGDIATQATRDKLNIHIGNTVLNFGNAAISANTLSWSSYVPTWTQYDRVCLALTELAAPRAPVLTAAAKTESIELTWTVEDHGASNITKFEYRIKESTDAAYPTTNAWTTIGTASNTGGSGTIGSLTNGTAYNVQVRGVNTEGNGDNSNEITATPDAPPAVSSVAITSTPATANTYIIGEDIEITVTFDKNLTLAGTDTSKKPGKVAFLTDYAADTAGTDHPEADCAIGTDTKTLVCTETVLAGWYDTDGIAVGANAFSTNRPITGVQGPLGQWVNEDYSASLPANTDHKIDGIRPTLSRADADPNDLTKIILTFSEAIGTVTQADITVKKGTTAQTIDSVAIDSTDATKVVVTLDTALLSTDTNVTVDLAADAVKDVPGNGIDVDLATPVSLVDNVAPTFVSAAISTNAHWMVLTYSETLSASVPDKSAFTVKVEGDNRAPAAAARDTAGTGILLTFDAAFRPGETVTVAYTKPGTNPIKDAADNEADSLAETTVSNDLAATAPEAPGNLVATATHADRVTLTWDTPWDNGSAITRFEYRAGEGGTVPPSIGWTAIADSGPTTTEVAVAALNWGTQHAFEVRAVNGEGGGDEAPATAETLLPTWSFGFYPVISGADKLTEGGASRTARLIIINDVRFAADQTITLKWGDDEISGGLIQGANGSATFAIDAGDREGELEISAPDRPGDLYRPPESRLLTANLGGAQVGESIALEFVDDEAKPVLSISLSRTGLFTESLSRMTIVEDGAAFVQGTLSRGYEQPDHTIELPIEMTGSLNRFANASSSFRTIDGKQIHHLIFVASTGEQLASSIRAADGSTAGDHSEHVFTLLPNDQYTIGSPSSATLTILDNDAAPAPPRNLRAQSRDGAVVLTWDAPTSLATTEFTAYELRHVAGSSPGGTFADISTDADTGSHTVTGLTNETEYTFELRAKNSFGSSSPVSVSKTPRVGVAVSFGAGSVSIREGGTRTVAVTLSEAPAAGTTVTVPISAMAGEGLDSGEYSGVPMNVVFAATDTSKSFTVATVDDTDDEPDRRLLTFSFGTLPEGYVPGTHETFVLTILDDDDPPGTLKARRGDGEVHLEWVPLAAVPGNRDRAHQLRYGAEGGESGQWRDIPRSAPGGRNGRSYTVTGLENGTRYAFELRVRRGSGFGPAAEIRQTPEAARWSVSANRRSVHEGEDVTVGIATSNAVGFYSAPEPLTVAVIGQIEFPGTTIEGADPEDFEIRVDGARVRGYAKDITFFDYDAIPGNDPFPAQHFDLEVPVGSTSVDVTVRVLADGDEEEQETMSFMVFRGEEWVNSGPAWGQTGVNIEPSDAGVVKQLAVADAEATEGEDPSLDFVVTLAPAAEWEVTVDYATEDGTATAGADYTDTNGTLTFAPGETEKTVSVPVIDDAVEDTPETLALRLSNADPEYDRSSRAWGSEEAGVLIADAVATGTIRNTEDAADLSADFPESAFASKRHAGPDDRPQVVVAFSEAVAEFAANTPSASVTGASGLSVQPHAEDGLENAYVFFMTPDGDGDVTFALTANAACAAGGICTAGGMALARVPAARTIAGPGGGSSSLSVADAEATEEGDGAMAFVVTLDPAARGAVTVDYATSDGSARAGDDYTATSGTLTFPAGETEKTISVPVADDAEDDGGETFALTLGDASGADLGDAEATGTIRDADATATPLTASFENLPASHDGSGEFAFRVEFSEDVGIGYATLRDDAFEVDEGDATRARRVDGRHDLWEITVEPDGREAVTITLLGDRACGETGAVCTRGEDPRPLSNSPSATVAGPTAAVTPTVGIAGGSGTEGDDSDIAFAVTLDSAGADTVTVDYATANGSATAGEDYTATSGTLSFAAGETGKTVSVPIADDIVNEGDETFTVTLSNASGAALGTASATGTIENRHVAPLTASFEQVPAEHDGTTFVFHVRFSEDPAVSYRVLRDESFGVTGGEVVAARRKDGRDDLREIHVAPSGNGDVTVSLPPTTDCNADGAICTADDRPLSNANAATVRAMAALSAADAETTEGAGATLEFAVTLSRAAAGTVTVGYATSDGTAVAGTDYTSASGTLTFGPGETSRTVSVTVLDDTVDDDGETLTLTLSNASGARLADATATGTINNADPLPRAWLVRFGRTSATQVVGLLTARFDEAATLSPQLTLGGRSWRLSALRGGADPVSGGADVPAETPSGRAGFASPAASTGLAGAGANPPGDGAAWSGAAPASSAAPEPDGVATAGGEATLLERTVWGLLTESAWQVDKRQFISRSSFDMSLSDLGNDPDESIETVSASPDVPGHWSLWGRGSLVHFGGVDDGVSLDGDVLTGLLGVDYARERWLAGVALAYHDGDGSYRSARRGDAGALDSALISVNPYLRYALTERLSVWGALGYGQGTLRLRPERDATVPQESIETGMQMGMGALGVRGTVYASERTELVLKSDALWVRTSSEDAPGMRAVDNADTSRIRLLLSGRHQRALANDALLTPSFELGLRVDDGEAERGFGMELGGGLRYADPVRGLALETRARALLAHEDGGYEEWGLSGSLTLDPGRLGRGLALRLDSGWGMADSGAEALWQRRSAAGLARQDNTPAQGRITAEMGYGLDVPYSYGILTPYSSVELAGGGNRTLRLGWRFELGQRLSLSLAGERRETALARPEHGLMLRTTLPW